MNALLQHLLVLPVLVPLVAGASMLFLAEARRTTRVTIAVTSMALQLAVAMVLLYLTSDAAPYIWPEGVGVYAVGNWPAPFGIVLVVDRLSAVMLTLSSVVTLSTLVYSLARWDRPGQPFHSLFQLLAMGLNGAFLTGDLFNLFVFFEVLLAASYGLMLRGAGTNRVRGGMHYIAVNLVASFLFLIGVSLIYGITGTLNMADLAGRAAAMAPADRALFDGGVAVLGIAFLIKAASWPLNFWLPHTYSIAVAPAAAVFSMLTKVGLYALLRVGTLLGEQETLGTGLFFLGIASLVAGTIGMLSAKHLAHMVSYSLLVSMGILLAALGLKHDSLTAPVLFYLIVSVLTTAIFFMLTGMTDRTRITDPPESPEDSPGAPEVPPATQPAFVAYGIKEFSVYRDEEGDEVGIAIPAVMAFLGLVFISCTLLVTGLPPLPGFAAKFSLLSASLGTLSSGSGIAPAPVWIFCAAVLVSGLAGVIALSRTGMRLFWSVTARNTPRLRLLEAAPVALLVLLALALGVVAEPVAKYLGTTAWSLHQPDTYVRTVLGGAQP